MRHPSPNGIRWKIAPSIPADYWVITPPKECQQNYSEANKDINGCSWQLAPALCIHYISFFFPPTHKRPPSKRCCAFMTGFAAPPHRPSGAHGFHRWDSQRSVMNIHVWSAAGKIPGEIERARKMNIELTCRAGRGLHSQLPSHNVLCC